jgi:acyl carrier protein
MTVDERLEELICELLNRHDIVLTDESQPSDISGWDSLVQINLMFGIEQQFGLRMEGNRIFDFQNFGELKRYIRERTTAPEVRLR